MPRRPVRWPNGSPLTHPGGARGFARARTSAERPAATRSARPRFRRGRRFHPRKGAVVARSVRAVRAAPHGERTRVFPTRLGHRRDRLSRPCPAAAPVAPEVRAGRARAGRADAGRVKAGHQIGTNTGGTAALLRTDPSVHLTSARWGRWMGSHRGATIVLRPPPTTVMCRRSWCWIGSPSGRRQRYDLTDNRGAARLPPRAVPTPLNRGTAGVRGGSRAAPRLSVRS